MESAECCNLFNFWVVNLAELTHFSVSCIGNEDAHINTGQFICNLVFNLLDCKCLRQVALNAHGFDLWPFLFDLLKFIIDFNFISRHDADVEPLFSKLMTHGQANTVRSTCDNSPSHFLAWVFPAIVTVQINCGRPYEVLVYEVECGIENLSKSHETQNVDYDVEYIFHFKHKINDKFNTPT